MNERIQALAGQAGAGWDDKYHWYVGNEQMKRFAELIVRECAGIYDKIDNGNDHLGTDNYLKALQRHFGIARERSNSKTC